MAVPKKRTSKTKTKVRKTLWKKKADKQACKAISKFGKINDSSKKTGNSIGGAVLSNPKNIQPKISGETKDIELGSDR